MKLVNSFLGGMPIKEGVTTRSVERSIRNVLATSRNPTIQSVARGGRQRPISFWDEDLPKRGLIATEQRRALGFRRVYDHTLGSPQDETHSNIFFTCEFTKIVWKGCDAIQSHCNRSNATNQLSRMTLSVTQYMIWKERNARIFHKIYQLAQELLHQIKEIVYIRGLKTNQMKNLVLRL
ncbi:hypothetical protein MTR_7g022620 [Medicago truncatula]|uniref:Uncharacterized protein n=1 Tax=Medicago truncatula TaxID=3880 RepID=G7KUT8_MEDTR|nr:hypothetical protein MTR_7g022620 [Medicago truncatula]